MLSSIWREKNPTTRCSPLINTIKIPILSINRVYSNGSVGDSVDEGSSTYVLRNMFIVVIDRESGTPELRKIVLVPWLASAVTWSRGPRPWRRFTHGLLITAKFPLRVRIRPAHEHGNKMGRVDMERGPDSV